jgi:peptide/nickel transport system permease protein
VQYGRYLWNVLHLDFGYSYGNQQSVLTIIAQRLPWTALLALAAITLQTLVGIGTGLISAAYNGRLLARGLLGLSLVAISLPPFWVALILLYLFAYVLPLFPMGGAGFPAPLVLPAVALALPGSAWYLRFMHAASVETLHADFILAARTKGAPPRSILFKHVFKASLSPLLTMIAIDFGYFLGGAVIIETVFGWPGIGLASFRAMQSGDIPLLMGCVLSGSFFVLAMNLVADTLRTVVDPRVQLS